jgi:hypothetical protein
MTIGRIRGEGQQKEDVATEAITILAGDDERVRANTGKG